VKLLLDGHIKKAAGPVLQRRSSGLDVIHIANWRGGLFRTADDEDILVACAEENRVFVTYDLRTIPGLLRRWALEERSHAGVIFGDRASVPPNDPGAVASALLSLFRDLREANMTNVVRFLRRA
jgi:hypothetical protein